MEKNQIIAELESLKSTLETSVTEKTKSDVSEALKGFAAEVDAKLDAFKNGQSNDEAVKAMGEEFTALKSQFNTLVSDFDVLQTNVKTSNLTKWKTKNLLMMLSLIV